MTRTNSTSRLCVVHNKKERKKRQKQQIQRNIKEHVRKETKKKNEKTKKKKKKTTHTAHTVHLSEDVSACNRRGTDHVEIFDDATNQKIST